MEDQKTESITDSLRAVYQQFSDDTESPEAAPEPEVSEPEPEVEAASDDDEVSLEGAEEEVTAEAEDDTEDEEPVEVFQPPKHWSSDEKEQFKALPEEAQKILLERDKQFQKGYQERVQGISDIEKALEPYKQNLALMGASEADAIRTLFAAHARLMQDPANGILGLAQQFGVMDHLREQFAPDTDDDFTDPEIKALRQQVQTLQSQLGNFQTQTQSQQQEQLLSQIDSFKNQTDDSGQLVHPYFDQVRTQMATLVQQGKSLDEAYNEAVWMVPEFRESHLKTVQSKKQSESEVDKARRVKKAKQAAKANKTSSKSKAEEDAKLTVRDELRAAWNQFS